MKVVQHIPGFVEQRSPMQAEDVPDADRMLEIPWIARWAASGGAGQRTFLRFSRSGDKLVVECDEGHWHWVVAYAEPKLLASFPEWKACDCPRDGIGWMLKGPHHPDGVDSDQ